MPHLGNFFSSKIKGIIRCHFSGSMENPYSSYDITVNFFRNKEQLNCNIDKTKKTIKLTESYLRQIIKENVKRILKENEENFWSNPKIHKLLKFHNCLLKFRCYNAHRQIKGGYSYG